MKKILVETSARHIHLTKETLEYLMGEGFELTPKKMLSQPGQYVSTTRLNLVGPKKSIANVSILGPFRKQSQVEISMTDARSIGISAPVRESGDLVNTPGCKLIGPVGELELNEGVIVAKRHIHATNKDAQELKVKDKDIVSVKINSNGRSLIFDDVVVRVSDSYALAMHIDTDESNAAACARDQKGFIVK